MSTIIQHPYFGVGVFAGLIAMFLITQYEEKRRRAKRFPPYQFGAKATDTMLQMLRTTGSVDLKAVFPKAKEPLGFLAWRSMALWLANVCASYSYNESPMSEYWDLANYLFGNDFAYQKLRIFHDALNFTPRFILNKRGMPYSAKEERDYTDFYDFVFLFIDSHNQSFYEDYRR